MPEAGPVKPPSRLARLRAALLAQQGAHGVGTIVLQLLLIALWHPVVLTLAWSATEDIIVPASKFWHDIGLSSSYISSVSAPDFSLPPDSEGRWLMLGILSSLALLEFVLAYLPYRVVTRRAPVSLAQFVRLWWRTWLWGTLVIPAGSALFSLLPQSINDVSFLALPAYVLVMPAWFAQREQRGAPRLARWRPVCPECGYSLRRAVADRCPECGQPFPTPSHVYRRWAWQRLTWDRTARGSLLFAYIKTALAVAFTPTRAARGLLLPDHFPRAIRWAAAHLLLIALLGLALGSNLFFPFAVVHGITREQDTWPQDRGLLPSPGSAGVWAAQSVVAWLVAAGVLPLLGILLGVMAPGRHPAAKRGIAKWSLYVSPLPLLVLAVGYAAVVVIGWRPPAFAGAPWWFAPVQNPLPASDLLLLGAAVYGVWWALGVSANPYLRSRGLDVAAIHAALYFAVWLLLTSVLFNVDGLRALL